MLIDQVIGTAKQILEEENNLISRVVAMRKRVEPWLHIDIFRRLSKIYPDAPLEIEKLYPGLAERCDLWCREANETESWIELKICVTNYVRSYGAPISARPITTQISDLNRDIGKLKRIPAEKSNRDVLLLAYPMPHEFRAHPEWTSHLARLDSSALLSEVMVAPIARAGKTALVVGYRLQL